MARRNDRWLKVSREDAVIYAAIAVAVIMVASAIYYIIYIRGGVE